jgi:hypothetical protein
VAIKNSAQIIMFEAKKATFFLPQNPLQIQFEKEKFKLDLK